MMSFNSTQQARSTFFSSGANPIKPQKWQVLVISPKLNEKVTDFKVILHNTTINANNNVKYLDTTVDLNLNFRCHLEVIERKLSRTVAWTYYAN